MSKKKGSDEVKAWLDFLYYEVGKQGFDFSLAKSYIAKNGEKKFSKWVPYMQAQEDPKFMAEAKHRQPLDIEVIIDIDPIKDETPEQIKSRYEECITKLRRAGHEFKAYNTGSRGYHIHLIFLELRLMSKQRREEFKEYFIEIYGGEIGKKIERCMIAIEHSEHWKTGNKKKLIDEDKGNNKVGFYLDEKDTTEMRQMKTDALSTFIMKTEELPQMLDHAVGSVEIGCNRYRYYGTVLRERIQETNQKGKTITIERDVLAIVTEEGFVFSKKSPPRDMKIEYESEMGIRKRRWSLESIRKFCLGELDLAEASFERVFKRFKKFYDEAMVFETDEWYSFNAVWDMTTYFYDMIDKFLIIKHEGMSGSAKSKGMKISANLSFNGKKFLCPTPANFFRYRHNNKATIYIEEAERLFDDTKKGNAADSELVEYLNGSYEKGNTVPRQNDKDMNKTDEFDPAGFTRIGAINPLKGALEKRSITLHMIKASSKDRRGDVEVPTENDSDYSYSRDMAYIMGLTHYKTYRKALNEVKNDYGMHNRQWTMAKPIVAMASCISDGLADQLGKFLNEQFNIRDDSFDSTSWEIVMGYALIKFYAREEGVQFIPNDALKYAFVQELKEVTGDEFRRVSPHRIAKIMKTMGYGEYKGRNSEGTQRGYNMSFFKVSEILIRNEFLKIQNILKKLSEVSECQYSIGKIRDWYTDTFSDSFPDTFCVSDTLTDRTLFFTVKEEKIEGSVSDLRDEDLVSFVEEAGKYDAVQFVEKYGDQRMGRLLEQGQLFENPKGTLQVLK